MQRSAMDGCHEQMMKLISVAMARMSCWLVHSSRPDRGTQVSVVRKFCVMVQVFQSRALWLHENDGAD